MEQKDDGEGVRAPKGYVPVTNGGSNVNRFANGLTALLAATVLSGLSSPHAVAGDGPDHGNHGQAGQASQPMCPVMGDEPANLAISTPTDDGPVFFCCNDCISKFQKSPAKYAEKASAQRKALDGRPRVQVTCPVSGDAVDKKVFVERDEEKIYFCCSACVSKYQNDPKKYAANLANSFTYQSKCPVMGNTIDPTSFTKLADGRTIYYCCNGCEGKLFGTPAKYAKNLATQGFQYNWSKVKKAGDVGEAAHKGGHEGHDHSGHDHP